MNGERLFSIANRWFVASLGITVGVFVLSAFLGFVALPGTQADGQFTSLWDSICSAAGFSRQASSKQPVEPDFKTSSAVMTIADLRNPSPESIGRGATLAQQCAICHGPTGISRADAPNLAGQYASVIYKQLHDFKSGARVNAVMSPFAANMTEQDMHDLAAYYAYLPKLPAYHAAREEPAPIIVVSGAPIRGIAPCGSCHGAIENKTGSPWLEGQSPVYLKAQLLAFREAGRRNDINQQMRNIARAMTSEEIDEAAAYYSSKDPLKQ